MMFFTPASAKAFAITVYYKPIDYTVTYNLNGGTNNSSNPTSYTVMTGFTLSNPTKTGYTFAGWDKTIPTTMPVGGMTINAKWNPNTNTKYTVYHYFENANDNGYSEYDGWFSYRYW